MTVLAPRSSAGDTIDEAMTGAAEAIAAWIEATREAGDPIPAASSLDEVRADPDYIGWTFAVVSVELASSVVRASSA